MSGFEDLIGVLSGGQQTNVQHLDFGTYNSAGDYQGTPQQELAFPSWEEIQKATISAAPGSEENKAAEMASMWLAVQGQGGPVMTPEQRQQAEWAAQTLSQNPNYPDAGRGMMGFLGAIAPYAVAAIIGGAAAGAFAGGAGGAGAAGGSAGGASAGGAAAWEGLGGLGAAGGASTGGAATGAGLTGLGASEALGGGLSTTATGAGGITPGAAGASGISTAGAAGTSLAPGYFSAETLAPVVGGVGSSGLSGFGDAAGALSDTFGSSIFDQFTNDPLGSVFNSAPALAAIALANKQRGDIDPYLGRMDQLLDQYQGNQSAYLRSLTDPYDMASAQARGQLTQGNALRGLAGSSFANQSMNNFDYMRDTGRSNILAQGINQGTGVQAGLLGQQIQAVNNRNLASNALIGSGLGASARLFSPTPNPFSDVFGLSNLWQGN